MYLTSQGGVALSERQKNLPLREWGGHPIKVLLWVLGFEFLKTEIRCAKFSFIPGSVNEHKSTGKSRQEQDTYLKCKIYILPYWRLA